MPRYLFTYPKDDNDFRPNQRSSKQLKIAKKKKQAKAYNRNGWDQDENRKYRQFLQVNNFILENREERREKKVFLMLSEHVQTRDANQCRSHHQKMIQKYKSIERTIEFLKYLECKQTIEEKQFSTCPPQSQLEPILQNGQIEGIDQIFYMHTKDDYPDELLYKGEEESFFNFLEDDIWLN